ncbi:MAG: MFS transporter [Pirellulales bacterium]|nr:MFS transporter [Pirellulales bacterium]
MSKRAAYALAVLFAVNTLNFFDRQILGAVGQPIADEWKLTDTQLGWLGTSFILLYAVVGLPFGFLADRANRARILAVGVFFWSLLTAASGFARGYWQLFGLRMGVGVGEASCAPAASSLLGDYFPARVRARAMSVFMMGLPIGIATSFAVSGTIAKEYGWRSALFVAIVPGVLCAFAALFLHEPARGGSEVHAVASRRREGWAFMLVLSTPTMRWIIASGALHNFNMYAIGSFIAPFLTRTHGQDVKTAGLIAAFCYGLIGVPGLLLGGFVGDALHHRRPNGRLLIGATCLALSVPMVYLAIGRPGGDTLGFLIFMSAGCGLMYTYYSTVYSSIQDVIEPALRGTAMALYFFAMYVFGAALGPVATGWLSETLTRHYAELAGVTQFTPENLLPHRAAGLHAAMYVIPILNIALAVVLAAASRTVGADAERLNHWMRNAATDEPDLVTAAAS